MCSTSQRSSSHQCITWSLRITHKSLPPRDLAVVLLTLCTWLCVTCEGAACFSTMSTREEGPFLFQIWSQHKFKGARSSTNCCLKSLRLNANQTGFTAPGCPECLPSGDAWAVRFEEAGPRRSSMHNSVYIVSAQLRSRIGRQLFWYSSSIAGISHRPTGSAANEDGSNGLLLH
jgi:hypothetical protein